MSQPILGFKQCDSRKGHFRGRLWWLLRGILNMGLLLLLIIQIGVMGWLLPDGHWPLPKFALDKINRELAKQGLVLATKDLEIDLRGYLTANQVQFGFNKASNPAIEAKRVLVGFHPLALLVGELSLNQIRIVEGTVYGPPVLSPTGKREAVIEKIHLRASRQGSWWELDSFHFKTAGFQIAAVGPLPESLFKPSHKKNQTRDLKSTFEQACNTLIETNEKTQKLQSPSLLLQLKQDSPKTVQVQAHYQSLGYAHPSGWRVGPHHAKGTALFSQDKGLQAMSPVIGQLAFLTDGETVKTDLAKFQLLLDEKGEGRFGKIRKASAFFYNIESFGLTFDDAFVEAKPLDGQTIQANIAIKQDKNWLSSQSTVSVKDRSAEIDLIGYWDPTTFLQAKPFAIMERLPLIQFATPPHFQAQVSLGVKGSFEQAWIAIQSGPASYESLNLKSFNTQVTVTPSTLQLKETELQTPDYAVYGQYWQNLQTNDYRFLMRGTIQPLAIAFIIEEAWWDELWSKFLYKTLPQASIDLRGRYGEDIEEYRHLYGWAQLGSSSYNGVPIDSASAYLWETPTRFDLIQLYIQKGKQSALVDLEWLYRIGQEDPISLAFTGHSNLPLKQLTQMIGPDAQEYEALLTAQAPPTLKAAGLLYEKTDSQDEDLFLNISADFPNQTVFETISFDRLAFEAYSNPSTIRIDSIDATVASGSLSGTAQLDASHFNSPERSSSNPGTLGSSTASNPTPSAQSSDNPSETQRNLTLDLALKQATLQDLFTTFPSLNLKQTQKQTQNSDAKATHEDKPSAQQESTETSYSGIIDLDFKGSGNPSSLETFIGQGNGYLRKANLGKLHLFGGLSHLMNSLGMSFGTLNFTTLKAEYTLRQGTLHIPTANVSGPTAKIEANGYYTISKGTLNFILTLYPLGSVKTPVVSQILSVLRPLAQTLEIRLTGNLENPSWTKSFGLLRIIKGQNKVKDPDNTQKKRN